MGRFFKSSCFFSFLSSLLSSWPPWVFDAARTFSWSSEGCSPVVVYGLLLVVGSPVGARTPEDRLSSCGTWASLPSGMWNLPGPGTEPLSPASAGTLLTTGPPEKSPPRAIDTAPHGCQETQCAAVSHHPALVYLSPLSQKGVLITTHLTEEKIEAQQVS